VLLVPAALHRVYRRRRLRYSDTLAPLIALLAFAVVLANLTVGHSLSASSVPCHAMLAAMALLTAALMPALLEHSVCVTQRHRPAVAAGIVWAATYLLSLVLAAAAEGMQCDRGATHAWLDSIDPQSGNPDDDAAARQADARRCTADRVKWLVVCAVGAAFILNVVSLLVARCALFPLNRLARLLQASAVRRVCAVAVCEQRCRSAGKLNAKQVWAPHAGT
jgi:heme A synthase